MAKKMYDIVPPKVAHKLEDTLTALEKKHKKAVVRPIKKKVVVPPAPASQKKSHFPLKEVLIGGVAVCLLLGVWGFAKLPQVEIGIAPKLETVELQEVFTADTAAATLDVDKKIIPARLVAKEQGTSEEFSATGILANDGKATGTITIYNKLDPVAPFTLIKGTHFVSNSGKYFIIAQKVTIPAATYQKGKLVAGSITVPVEAKEAGEEFNIGASQFSVPKLSGTKYYYSILAESNVAMKGGHVGQVKKVTKEDIERAEKILTDKLFAQTQAALAGKISADEIMLTSVPEKKIISAAASVEPDTVAEVFTADVKVRVLALVVLRQDLENFSKEIAKRNLPDGMTYWEKSMIVKHDVQMIDSEGEKASVSMDIALKSYTNIDTGAMANQLIGGDENHIRQVISQIGGDSITHSSISFWPFWVSFVPKDTARINIHLVFE